MIKMKVAPHTSLKHRMLGMYFLICRQVAKKRLLYYVDLYAGDGEAECDEAPLKRWESPFVKSLLEHAKKGTIKLKCFLNDLDPKNEGYYERLKEKVKPYKEFIISLTKEDANIIYKDILKQIPKTEWSIFFLDPFKHNDLDWNTIEEISKHETYDKISNCNRKPELIINLMTVSMQRTMDIDPDSITKALGTDEWKEKVKDKTTEKVYEIFSDIFAKKLEELGYSVTLFQIKQTPPNESTLYYIIFASNIPAANKIISEKYKPYIDSKITDKWTKENFKYRMITREEKKGTISLTRYQ